MSNSYKTKTVGYDGDENLNANAIFLSAPKPLLTHIAADDGID